MSRKRKSEEWKGSVFKPTSKSRLRLRIKVNGAWITRLTPFLPHDRAKAEELLAEVRDRLISQESAMAGRPGPVTVRAWGKRWLEKRQDSRGDDRRNLELHVYPVIGDMLLSDVGTRHIAEMVESWQEDAQGARLKDEDMPGGRTIGNWYSTCRSLFRDAAVKGLINSSPCILTSAHLPPREDKDSEWRGTAKFKRSELERLITEHPEVEPDSTICYGLLGLAALRHGEMAALRWRHYDSTREPLGELTIANSYKKRRTKTGRTRWMPVHPTLAAMLASWRLAGWERLMGRPPTEEDLIVPLPLTERRTSEMRRKDFTWKRAERHLQALGMRHRRVHDLRRTFFYLAEADGADRLILGWGTHGRGGDVLSSYADPDWRRICGEVAKLSVKRGPEIGPRVEACSKGHPRTPENTYRYPSGHVACRVCVRAYALEYQRKKREAGRGVPRSPPILGTLAKKVNDNS